jgi:hypothetical protein
MYDTSYHLNADGRRKRTKLMLKNLIEIGICKRMEAGSPL